MYYWMYFYQYKKKLEQCETLWAYEGPIHTLITPHTFLPESSSTSVNSRPVKAKQDTQVKVSSSGAGVTGRPSTAKWNDTKAALQVAVQEINYPPSPAQLTGTSDSAMVSDSDGMGKDGAHVGTLATIRKKHVVSVKPVPQDIPKKPLRIRQELLEMYFILLLPPSLIILTGVMIYLLQARYLQLSPDWLKSPWSFKWFNLKLHLHTSHSPDLSGEAFRERFSSCRILWHVLHDSSPPAFGNGWGLGRGLSNGNGAPHRGRGHGLWRGNGHGRWNGRGVGWSQNDVPQPGNISSVN